MSAGDDAPPPPQAADSEEARRSAVEIPIDGVLDLHPFRPGEVAEVVAAYLDECVARGIADVRLIHGKGTGVQREIVHGALRRHPAVAGFRAGGAGEGGWGATVVRLNVAK